MLFEKEKEQPNIELGKEDKDEQKSYEEMDDTEQ